MIFILYDFVLFFVFFFIWNVCRSSNSAECENGTSSSGGDDHQLQVPPLTPEISEIELQ